MTLVGVSRASRAGDVVALLVYERAGGQSPTMRLVRSVIDELLHHPAECDCGRCEAAALTTERVVYHVVRSWCSGVAASRRRALR